MLDSEPPAVNGLTVITNPVCHSGVGGARVFLIPVAFYPLAPQFFHVLTGLIAVKHGIADEDGK